MQDLSEKNRKWWGLIALVPALAMIFMDQTILPVALPTMKKFFGASDVALEWTVNSYLLVIAVLVLVCGKIGDRFGHRQVFTGGMILFAAASCLCGMSETISWLIAARVLQGVGAALMFPASTALLMSLFPPAERGKATGINVSISSLFLIMGPLIGGYLSQNYSWRWIFWVNLPIAALGVFLVYRLIPASRRSSSQIDPWGFLFFTIFATSFVSAFMEGREWGWDSLPIQFLFGLSIISAAALFLREKKAKHPFLDLSLFKHPIYKAVNISVFFTQFILMITVFRSVFMQDTLGWSPIKTGFVTFLSCTPVLFAAPIGGILSDRFGPKFTLSIGFSCLIFSFIWVAFFIKSSLAMILIGFFAMGFGIPLVMTPSYSSAMGAIPPQKAGSGFGTIATIRSLGSCMGIALIGSLIDNIEFFSFKKGVENEHLDPLVMKKIVSEGIEGETVLKTLPSGIQQDTLNALFKAQYDGFFFIHLILGVMLIAAFIAVFLLYHRKSKHQLPKAPAEGWD